MARDSRNRTRPVTDDNDSVGGDVESPSDGVVVADNPVEDEVLPDWLWAQHNAPPPQQESEE